jgi:hypothetical protein
MDGRGGGRTGGRSGLVGTGYRRQECELRYSAGAGTARAVAIGDLNGDGRNDLVLTCEQSAGTEGVWWLQQLVGGSFGRIGSVARKASSSTG